MFQLASSQPAGKPLAGDAAGQRLHLAISRVQVPDYVVRELKSRYLTEQEQQADRAAIAARKQEAEERKKREELRRRISHRTGMPARWICLSGIAGYCP